MGRGWNGGETGGVCSVMVAVWLRGGRVYTAGLLHTPHR